MTRAPDIHPVTRKRWPDLVDLFERPGPRGAWPRTSACYCMFWRIPPAEYEAAFRQRSLEGRSGGPNKTAMKRLVESGAVPGLLAYRDGEAIGWVSISPRAELLRLDHVPAPGAGNDRADERTWSVSCFYVHRSAWRSGVAAELLAAAVARASEHGASSVEGYPVKAGSVDPYTGYDTMFAHAGFRLVRPGRGKGRALWREDLPG
ncbi:MAG TPA: GNAT family N-acetyltransferase [Gaiellaceae bacterium]|nr:GNAT family N-acetyltransferase [Gaiellaceae bacterium]